jgi:hypothetical protein
MGQGRWRQERARLLAFDVQADIVPAPRERGTMQQQISIITLGIDDLPRSRCFYTEGFGWAPVFENAEILFYQMNGLL